MICVVDDLCGRSLMWSIYMLENIFRSNIYLCFIYLSRNEVIISRASLDSVKSKQSVAHN